MNKNDSFLDKKPILKKRTASEVMLQKSISTSSLVKQAAAAVQAQRVVDGAAHDRRSRPTFGRAQSDYVSGSPRTYLPEATSALTNMSASSSSGLQSPDAQAGRHIRFDDKVEQCIAVDFKNGEAEEEEPEWTRDFGESSEEELVMKARPRRRTSTVGQARANMSQDSKGIAMLPSTTLKYHQDDPTCPGHSAGPQSNSWKPGKLVPSASQETLRPSKPSSNFLVDGDDDADVDWEPSGAFNHARKDSVAVTRDRAAELSLAEHGEEVGPHGLRRTASGMFMPFDDEDDEDNSADTGILGRFVESVNTARDIAHVIWNVGWRK